MTNRPMSLMPTDSSIAGTERLLAQGTNGSIIVVSTLKDYVIDQLVAAAAITPTTGDALLVERSGAEGTFDLDALVTYVLNAAFDSAAVTSTTSGDLFVLERSGDRKRITIDNLSTSILTGAQATILNLTGLTAATPGASDLFLFNSSTTAKKITLANLETQLWTDFATYVAALSAVTTTAGTDKFYCIQGGTAKYVTPVQMATYFALPNGDVTGPSSTTENNVPQWDSTTKKLKDGLTVVTTLRTVAGGAADTALATEQATAEAVADITRLNISGATDIGAALATGDLLAVYDLSATANRYAAMSRVTTYVESNVKLDNLAAPDDNTDLNASTSAHGLVVKATAPSAGTLNVVGIGNAETAYTNKTLFDATNPAALGTAGPGTSLYAAHRDHIHAMPTLDGVAAPTDVTTLNASVSAHGLLPKLGGGTTNFLRADGTWSSPTASWSGDITDVDFSTGSDIGAALESTDQFIVGDDSDSDNPKRSAVLRLKTYLETTGHYENIYVDAAAMVPCTTNGAASNTYEYPTNDIDMDLFAFDGGATEERVQFKLVMPENWDRGTIKVKFYWGSAAGSTAGDTVEWAIKAGALSNDDAIDAALGTPQVISDTLLINDGTDIHISAATPALTVAGSPALGDMIVFEVYRNTDGTDDMTEDAWLFGVLIQYQRNTTVAAW